MGIGPVSETRRAVFLDRDGVLDRVYVENGKPHPPATLEELEILPGVPEALRTLKARGFLLIVATNQPDVARGTRRRELVEAINAALMSQLPLDDIRVCYHDDPDDCACRKPRPGMLLDAAVQYGIDLTGSFMIGDRDKDIEAGQRAGCKTIMMDKEYLEPEMTTPDFRARTLPEAADWIIATAFKGEGPLRSLSELRVKIFADGADKAGMLAMYQNPLIKGFTTNPTLMRKAGVSDFEAFARDILCVIKDRPVSFEVFSDEFDEMERQAHKITEWGPNVHVKIPITNTRRESSIDLIHRLAGAGIKLNITACMTLDQLREASAALAGGPSAFVSLFAGRIADTGRDPVPMIAAGVEILKPYPQLELLWASPRELLNVFQADAVGCHIITATNDILKKLEFVGKDLGEFSLDTVKMFHDDAAKAGYVL